MNLTLFEKNKSNRLPNLFSDSIFDDWPFGNLKTFSTASLPPTNIVENETETIIELALPGLDKKDIKITIDDGLLSVSHETQQQKEEKSEKVIYKEFNYSSFTRSFQLPAVTDTEKIESKLENGILSINIPKNSKNTLKSIDIK